MDDLDCNPMSIYRDFVYLTYPDSTTTFISIYTEITLQCSGHSLCCLWEDWLYLIQQKLFQDKSYLFKIVFFFFFNSWTDSLYQATVSFKNN